MSIDKQRIDELAKRIIGLAIEIHKTLGPGFVEKIYEEALSKELFNNKIGFEPQKEIIVKYKGSELGRQRLDFFVDNKIIVEVKAVAELNNIHIAQLLSYLKAADKRLGLLLNFATPILKIKRVVNNF